MLISGFEFSDDQYSVEEMELTIAEGESYELVVTYTPIFAGGSNETLTILSNDPNEPELVVDLIATGISEVSGEICGTWSLVNSLTSSSTTSPCQTTAAWTSKQVWWCRAMATTSLPTARCLFGEEGSRIRLENLDLDMELDGNGSITFSHANVEYANINSNGTKAPLDFDWDNASLGVEGWYNSGGSGGSVSRDGENIRSEYWSSSSSWRDIYFYSPQREIATQLDEVF